MSHLLVLILSYISLVMTQSYDQRLCATDLFLVLFLFNPKIDMPLIIQFLPRYASP